jgi:hypothetical protein
VWQSLTVSGNVFIVHGPTLAFVMLLYMTRGVIRSSPEVSFYVFIICTDVHAVKLLGWRSSITLAYSKIGST